jgi:hypothetical protein
VQRNNTFGFGIVKISERSVAFFVRTMQARVERRKQFLWGVAAFAVDGTCSGFLRCQRESFGAHPRRPPRAGEHLKPTMKHKSMWVGLLAFVLVPTFLIFAQQTRPGDFRISRISYGLVRPPAVVTDGEATQATRGPRDWLRIEVLFESAPDWADDVQLKYHVLVGQGRDARMFVGEITHVNVRRGRRVSAMFMHPNVIDRYGRGQVQAVAVELRHQNQLMDIRSEPPAAERWWERRAPTTGFLLSPQYTPWALIAHERYEAQKFAP